MAAAHQTQFNLVLDVFDVEGAATWTRANEARTTVSVRPSTVSRTLAEAAPCVP